MGLGQNIVKKVFGKQFKLEEKLMIASAVKQIKSTSKQFMTYGGFSDGASGEHSTGALENASYKYNNYVDNYRTRIRAKDSYLNQPMFKGIISRQADTIVDRGLVLESVPDADFLNLTDDQVMKWKSQVERSFHRWALDKKSTRTGTMNFYQLQRLAFTGQFRDGEYFGRFFYSNRSDLQNPLQLGLVSPDMINGYGLTSTRGFNYPNGNGIDYNSQGEEIAYNIFQYNKGDFDNVRVPAIGSKSKKRMMIHGFRPEFEDQTRGYSELYQALQWVQKITDLSDAQLQKEIINASVAMYVKPSENQKSSNPFSDLPTDDGAGFNDFNDINTAEDGENATETTNEDLSCTDKSDTLFTRPGVSVFNLNEGEDLKSFEFNRKNTEFQTFVDLLMEYLSSASGMPLEVLKMKFGQNYSASRAALKLYWRVAEQWRMELATDFLNPVYEAWLSGEIAAGRITAPGWSDPRIKAAWLQCNWIGPPEPDIDPSKQADAIQKYIDMGLSNREREARKLNGTSFVDNSKRLKKENVVVKELNDILE